MSVKISQLTASAALTSDDFFPVVDSGSLTTLRVSSQQILNYITGSVFNNLNITSLTGSNITGSTALFTVITSSFSGSGAGLHSIPVSALTDSTITIGSTSVQLGATTTTIQSLLNLTSSNITGSTVLFTIISGTNVDISENLRVGGDLFVSGSIVSLEISNLKVEDPIIVLGSSSAGSSLTDGDRGFVFSQTGSNKLAFGWDHSESVFKLGSTSDNGETINLNITPSGTLEIQNLSGSGYAKFDSLNISTTSVFSGSIFVSGSSIYGQVAELTSSTDNYTLLPQDSGKFLNVDSGSVVNVAVPAGLPTGFTISVCQLGSGSVAFVTGSGVIINNRQSHTKTAGQFAVASIVGTAADVYVLVGDTTT